MHELLHIDVAQLTDTVLFTVVGEVDVLSAGHLRSAVETAPADQSVVIDLAGVGFMDSTGLGVLITEWMRVGAAGGSLRVQNPSVQVRRLLDVSCLDHLIDGRSVAS